jgi:hypothetical protein
LQTFKNFPGEKFREEERNAGSPPRSIASLQYFILIFTVVLWLERTQGAIDLSNVENTHRDLFSFSIRVYDP